MMINYVLVTDYLNKMADSRGKKQKLFAQQQLNFAKKKTQGGLSKRKIAKLLVISESILRYNLKKVKAQSISTFFLSFSFVVNNQYTHQ